MDAPAHFINQGQGIDRLPLAAMIGPARVVQVDDRESVKPEHLERARPGERLLLKTRSSERCWSREPFDPESVHISLDAAHLLAARGVALVGIDYLSVGGFRGDSAAIHRALLESGAWIIEGLDLSGVEAGDYELICLPLRVVGADGAPARALLRPRS